MANIVGTNGADTLVGTNGDDLIQGLGGDDILNGGLGADTLDGGTGSDTFYVDNAGDVVIEAVGEGYDVVWSTASSFTLNAGAEVEYLALQYGTTFDGILAGNAFAQLMIGNAGNNILNGGGGADGLYGGAGNDTFYVDNAGDYIIEAAGEGYDVVWSTASSFTLNAGAEVEYLALQYGTSFDGVLAGNELNQLVIGNAGNNILSGGGGADGLYGGAGSDTFYVDNAGDYIIEVAGEGYDVVWSTASSFTLNAGANVEYLALQYGTSFDGVLVGNELNQLVIGNAGNNILSGGGGADGLYGGAGSDTFYVDNVGDYIIEAAGEGYDVVWSTASSFTLNAGAEVEYLALQSGSSFDGVLAGNELNQLVIGNAGNNILSGGGGADGLYGGAGSDTFYVDNAGDYIIEAAGEGYDVVWSTASSFTLNAGANVEYLALQSGSSFDGVLVGNELNQLVIGNAGNNILNGGGGADGLYGGTGDDTFYVDNAGDYIIETAGQGYDVVYVSAAAYTLNAGAEVEYLALQPGSNAPAILTGNEFNQVLAGGSSGDILNGGGGADTMHGFGGNDTYYVDNVGDTVVDGVGGGQDVIYVSDSYFIDTGNNVAYILASNMEIETVALANASGTGNYQLVGNAYGQTLIGNAGNNNLFGGGGADILRGLGGNDMYRGIEADDVIVESVGGGLDQITAIGSYVLAAGVEVEELYADNTLSTNINLTGNEFNQLVYGGNGANIIDGRGGNDILVGLGGADTFVFSTALGSNNVDTINDFVLGTDRIELSGAIFSALATGSLSNNWFTVGAAATAASHLIVYNSANGALYYDADGNGAGAAVQFATLLGAPALTAASFTITGAPNGFVAISSGSTGTVAENSPASTIVYQTVATDPDGDRIIYSLSGADAAFFNIDAVTGAVRLNNPADYEARTSYSITVNAADSSGWVTGRGVTITVTDVADTGGGATPTLAETTAANNNVATAQVINRATLTPSNNPNLTNDDLPSITINGSINPATDIDFYAITLNAGEQLILDIDGVTGGLDAVIRIYDSSGTLVGYIDDSARDTGSAASPYSSSMTLDSFATWRPAASGTYYFSVESYGEDIDEGPGSGTTSGTYQLHVSIGPVASAAQINQENIQALISGSEWNHTALTYGFPTLASQYPASFEEAQNGFAPFTSTQQTATTAILRLVSDVSTLTFQQGVASPGQMDLRFAMTAETGAAHAYYPTNGGPSSLGGTAWFNTTDFNSPARGNYAWMGILHEIGHALGLKHGHELPALSGDRDSVEYSVMTYRSYVGDNLNGYGNETWGYPQTLMMYDIAALQIMYGANWSVNAGDSVYSWNPSTGQMSINGVGQGAPGGNRVFMTIWDGNGVDTHNLSAYSSSVTIDLRPGEWTITSQTQLANLGGGNYARGNVANALLFNGDTRSLIENAVGGSGADVIIANQAANSFTGNGGADIFRWMETGHSTLAATDRITDFAAGSDRIDLSFLDANTGTAGDQAFFFNGTMAFNGVAGQLRYEAFEGGIRILGDVNGDAVADFALIVTNVTTIAQVNFIL